MCRSIKRLHNFRPPATAEEIRVSALQFVRKLSRGVRRAAGEASDADGGDRSSGQGFLAGCGAAPVREVTPRV
jgi:uncharacterized protein DUF2277